MFPYIIAIPLIMHGLANLGVSLHLGRRLC